MVQVKDIMAVMEGIAPRKLAESWDKPVWQWATLTMK